MKKPRSGFTIVELLMVIGIIAVLTGIVTTAAAGAMKNSRKQRAKSLCALVQAGLAAYHAQEGKWPITISGSRSNNEGDNNESLDDIIVLNGNEVRTCCRALVQATADGKPVMDVSGLYISRSDGELGTNSKNEKGANRSVSKLGYGVDFMTGIRGSRKNATKMKPLKETIYFGYPDPETGRFLRFYMTYSRPMDTITVTHWPGRGW